jgi:two-component system chemotaxis sensor kinase CheA
MLDARSEGSVYQGDISGIKARLAALLPADAKAAPKQAKQPIPAAQGAPKPMPSQPAVAALSGGPALSEYEILELREAAGPGRRIFRIALTFNPDNVMKTVSALHVFAALRDTGTVLKTIPDFEKLYEDNFYPVVEYFVAVDKDSDELNRKANIPDVVNDMTIEELLPEAIAAPAPPTAPKAQPKAQPQAAKAPEPAQDAIAVSGPAPSVEAEAPTPDAEHHDEARKVSQGSILRVDSRRIDNLLNLVSETVINKATFNQISSRFGELMGSMQSSEIKFRDGMKDLFDELPDYLSAIQQGKSAKDVKKEILEKYGFLYQAFDGFEADLKNDVAKFRSTAQNLGRITGELQEGVMRIRMVPISQIFSRFPRLVRDLTKTLNPKVNLVIEGEDTELDKSVIEDLLDPIMHSVRNAIDHGVETPEERIAAGKDEEGTVLLKASNEGNMIVIEISDDGKGIDVEAVRAKAIEKGLIHPSKVLTDVEAFNLIFDAGFSTAKKVTNISGRGVGLDVVKRQVEKLNGSVTVSSHRGKGTRYTIKLPLTLAIIQGLLVRVGKEVYSIPITSVIESHRIKPADVKMIDNYEVFNIRSDVVALLRLNRLFKIPTNEQRITTSSSSWAHPTSASGSWSTPSSARRTWSSSRCATNIRNLRALREHPSSATVRYASSST